MFSYGLKQVKFIVIIFVSFLLCVLMIIKPIEKQWRFYVGYHTYVQCDELSFDYLKHSRFYTFRVIRLYPILYSWHNVIGRYRGIRGFRIVLRYNIWYKNRGHILAQQNYNICENKIYPLTYPRKCSILISTFK